MRKIKALTIFVVLLLTACVAVFAACEAVPEDTDNEPSVTDGTTTEESGDETSGEEEEAPVNIPLADGVYSAVGFMLDGTFYATADAEAPMTAYFEGKESITDAAAMATQMFGILGQLGVEISEGVFKVTIPDQPGNAVDFTLDENNKFLYSGNDTWAEMFDNDYYQPTTGRIILDWTAQIAYGQELSWDCPYFVYELTEA